MKFFRKSAASFNAAKLTLTARALHAVIWLLAQNIFARAVSFVSQIMLAWFLLPSDFGIIGLAYVVVNVVSVFQNFGVDNVLLQRKDTLRFWVDEAFFLCFSSSTLCCLAVLLASPFVALAFKSHFLEGILAILALSMPIGALSTVPTVILRAQMRFGIIATYATAENIATSALTILLAWRGFGAYSFVLPIPLFSIVKAISFHILAPPPANRLRRKNSWKLLFANSAAVFGVRLINAAISQGDYFVLGLFYSHSVVGNYYFAFRISAQPLWMLAGNFSNVIFPALVDLKDDIVRQSDAAFRASEHLSYSIFIFGFLQAAVAHPLVTEFFEKKWLATIPTIEILSVGLAFDAVSWVAGSLLGARGEFKRLFIYVSTMSPMFFLFVIVGALIDAANGVAVAVSAYYIITQPIVTYLTFRVAKIPVIELTKIYTKPALFAALATGLGVVTSHLPPFQSYQLLQAAVICAVSLLAYIALVRFGAPRTYRDAASRAKRLIQR